MIKVLCLINNCTDTVIPLEAFEKIEDEEIQKTIVAFFQTPKNLNNNYAVKDYIIPLGHLSMIPRIRKLYKIMKSNDIIHVHHIGSAYVAAILNVLLKKKLIITAHSSYNRWKARTLRMMDFCLKQADMIIANSKATFNSIPSRYNFKKKVIFNGVDLSNINQKNEREWQNNVRLISVGRLEEVKNLFVILEAIKLLKEKNINVKYTLVGDGKLRQKLQDKIEELQLKAHVDLLGFKPREEVYRLLAHHDLFIVSSHVEGFCNSLIEGMASGLIAIVSDIDIFRELYTDRHLYYFDKDNSEDLAVKIECCINSPDVANQKAHDGMNKVKQDYSLDKCVDQHIRLYKSLILMH